MSQQDKFNFDENFQTNIITMMLRDPTFLVTHGDIIKPHYFTNIYHQTVCSMVYDYFNIYREIPSKTEIDTELVKRGDTDGFGQKHELMANYRGLINRIYMDDMNNSQYIYDTVMDFCEQREYEKLLSKSYAKLKESNDKAAREEIAKLMMDVINNGFANDMGVNLKEVANEFREVLNKQYSHEVRIPSGIGSQINAILHGGYKKGGLYCFVAPPERGKSTVLASEACAFLRSGYDVNLYTFELDEIEFLTKIMSNITYMTPQEIQDARNEEVYFERIQYFLKYKQNLNVKYFERNRYNINAIRSHASKLNLLKQKKTDVSIIDYADLMLPVNEKGDMYQDKGNIYSDLKAFARGFDQVVLTVSQPKRDAYNGDEVSIITMDHLEGSSMKAHILDGLFSINQNSQERDMDPPMVRIYNAKVRSGTYKKYQTRCELIYDYSKINEIQQT